MKYSFVVICVFLFGCHEQNKNKVSPAELMKSREIKKVSEAEILKKGSEIGDELLSTINQLVLKKVNSDTLSCDVNAWSEIDSLGKNYQTRIQRINATSAGITNLEYQLLSAYQYNLENQIDPTSAVQKLDSKTVLFVYPIDSESNIYKYCLDSLGRKEAHLWSLKVPIKEIINRL